MRSFPASAMYRHVFRVTSHRSFFLGLSGTVILIPADAGGGGPGPVVFPVPVVRVVVVGIDAILQYFHYFFLKYVFIMERCSN